jgi:hypothetical protein
LVKKRGVKVTDVRACGSERTYREGGAMGAYFAFLAPLREALFGNWKI